MITSYVHTTYAPINEHIKKHIHMQPLVPRDGRGAALVVLVQLSAKADKMPTKSAELLLRLARL